MRTPALALLLWLPAATAWADDIATDEDVCRNREVGAACSFDGGSGTCQSTTCNRIDYSGGKPKPATRECLRCLPGAAAAAAPAATVEPAAAAPTPASTAEAPPTPAAPPTGGAAPATAGCTIDPGAGSLLGALLGLGLLVLGCRGRAP